MATRGKTRRKVDWRALGGPIEHAYVRGQHTSVCGSVSVNRVPERDYGSLRPDRCRPCEITLNQTW